MQTCQLGASELFTELLTWFVKSALRVVTLILTLTMTYLIYLKPSAKKKNLVDTVVTSITRGRS